MTTILGMKYIHSNIISRLLLPVQLIYMASWQPLNQPNMLWLPVYVQISRYVNFKNVTNPIFSWFMRITSPYNFSGFRDHSLQSVLHKWLAWLRILHITTSDVWSVMYWNCSRIYIWQSTTGAIQNKCKGVVSCSVAMNTFETSLVFPDPILQVVLINESLIDKCHLEDRVWQWKTILTLPL